MTAASLRPPPGIEDRLNSLPPGTGDADEAALFLLRECLNENVLVVLHERSKEPLSLFVRAPTIDGNLECGGRPRGVDAHNNGVGSKGLFLGFCAPIKPTPVNAATKASAGIPAVGRRVVVLLCNLFPPV